MSKGDWASYESGRIERGLGSRYFAYQKPEARSALPRNEAELNDFYWGRGGSSPVVAQMDELGLYAYDNQGRVTVQPDKVRDRAAVFVKEVKNLKYEQYDEGIEYYAQSPDGRSISNREATRRYNRAYSVQAQAILTSAEVGKVKLTDVQQKTLEDVRNGGITAEYRPQKKTKEWKQGFMGSAAQLEDFKSMTAERRKVGHDQNWELYGNQILASETWNPDTSWQSLVAGG